METASDCRCSDRTCVASKFWCEACGHVCAYCARDCLKAGHKLGDLSKKMFKTKMKTAAAILDEI